MPEMHVLAVDQPYLPDGRRVPPSVQYNYRAGGHELLLVFDNLTSREVKAVRTGPCAFALYAEGEQIILLYRFGEAIPWSDAPYTIHRVSEDERTVPPPVTETIGDGEEPHALLTIILVRQETGIVEAIRAVTLSPAFTVALHAAIQRQSALPYDARAYDMGLAALYRRYPTTRDLLAVAASRTVGGR